jgi:hypothetical protein
VNLSDEMIVMVKKVISMAWADARSRYRSRRFAVPAFVEWRYHSQLILIYWGFVVLGDFVGEELARWERGLYRFWSVNVRSEALTFNDYTGKSLNLNTPRGIF